MKRISTLLAVAALSAPAAFAQTTFDEVGTMKTDRPGLIPATTTVGRGVFQVEVGAVNAEVNTEEGAEYTNFNFPTTLRYGITDGIELQAGTDVYNFFSSDAGTSDVTADGLGTAFVGAKITVPAGVFVNTAIMPRVMFALDKDAGFGGIATEGPAFGLDFVSGFGLGTSAARLYARLGADVAKVSGRDEDGAFNGDIAYRALGRVAARLAFGEENRGQFFGETGYNTFQFSSVDKGNAYAGGGYKFALAHNVMLDASALYGFNEAATWNFGAGASVRF